MKKIEVVAAIIHQNKQIFATQRGYGDFKGGWEFPGGKVEPGETPEAALVREIREELAVEISVGELLTTVEYDYPNFHLTMHCYLCQLTGGEFRLLEHQTDRWLGKGELYSVEWLPADVGVIPLLERIL